MVSIGRVTFLMIFLASLVGCASMNKSECLNADWHMIGMEDGSQGQPVSYIGKHRKACADYNIKPDLATYEAGHAAGMVQFCTESNGFRLGRNGGFYDEVCPLELEENFLTGYDAGRKIHVAKLDFQQAANAVKSNQAQLEKLKQDIKEKEVLLVSSETSIMTRIHLLEEIREDRKKADDLEAKALILESDKQEKLAEFEEIKEMYQY
jgi:hypothetical protein